MKAEFGIVGLGTMGGALLQNMVDHGFHVAGYDLNQDKADALNKIEGIAATTDVEKFVDSIRAPRAIMLLVPAGPPVDSAIQAMLPHLKKGDFLLDGGNSYFKDTSRREKELREAGYGFMGMGVSGGEAGARNGPSMMPGGTQENYDRVKDVLEAIAAKYEGQPCVALMGAGAAGHYVKMVHNGIEYAMMQLIAEAYDLMKRSMEMSNEEIAAKFKSWDEGSLGGYLVEITSVVLSAKDADSKACLVDMISDKAKAKGTGKWTSQDAMDLGIAVPMIDAAVNAREMSALKDERVAAAKRFPNDPKMDLGGKEAALAYVPRALLAAFLLAYDQGLTQIRAASEEYGFGTDLSAATAVWRAGCIIRSKLLGPIHDAVAAQPDLPNLLMAEKFDVEIEGLLGALRSMVTNMINHGIPVPAFSAALAYFDTYRSAQLPSNLIQGQRDLFGAHTYERTDKPGTFHTHWEE